LGSLPPVRFLTVDLQKPSHYEFKKCDNMNSGELTLEFDEPIHTNELSFSELTLTDSSDAQIPTSEQVEPALPTWIAQYFNSG